MKKVILGLATSMAVLFLACNKEEVVPVTDYSTPEFNVTVESVVTADAAIDDVVEAADYEVDLLTGSELAFSSIVVEDQSAVDLKGTTLWDQIKSRYRLRKCPDISIISEDGGFPKTITLDYGDTTELANGRILSGVIEIVISAPYREDGATRTVSYLDFKVDSIGISGTNVTTFLGDRITERVVDMDRDMVFTLPDGTIIERTAEYTRTWVEGLETPFYYGDDVIEITGFANCEDSDGNVYRKEITEKLVKNGTCRFIVSGEVSMSANGNVFATINYGDGTCDNVATLTTADGTKEIIIGKRVRTCLLIGCK